MNEKNDMIIFKSGHTGKELTIVFSSDTVIFDWVDIFKTILIFKTFHPDTIKKILKGEDEEET